MALFRTLKLRVEELPVVELGENVATTRFGTPVMEKLTLPANPPVREMEIA